MSTSRGKNAKMERKKKVERKKKLKEERKKKIEKIGKSEDIFLYSACKIYKPSQTLLKCTSGIKTFTLLALLTHMGHNVCPQRAHNITLWGLPFCIVLYKDRNRNTSCLRCCQLVYARP